MTELYKRDARIAMILVETETPDNIGAAARAVKNMGLQDLRLVLPPAGWKKSGKKMAMSALDLLESSQTFTSLEDAVRDLSLVIGTSRRKGAKRGAFIPFHEAIKKIKQVPAGKKAAVVFGKESKGLSNAQLMRCDWITTIPSHPIYPSLNLAQAVMVVCYSLFTLELEPEKKSNPYLIPKNEVEEVLARFREAVRKLGYKEVIVERIVATLRALVKRNGLKSSEGQMIKGISKRICDRIESIFQGSSHG